MTGSSKSLGEEWLGGGKAATKPLLQSITACHFDRREKSLNCMYKLMLDF